MAKDVLDDRQTHVADAIILLKVPIRSVPWELQEEIADALVSNRDYKEQVRMALTARGYLPQPEMPSRIPEKAPAQ